MNASFDGGNWNEDTVAMPPWPNRDSAVPASPTIGGHDGAG